MRDKLIKALKRKALGLKTLEIVKEYSFTNGNMEIVKKKVTQKELPPDLNAVKILLSYEDDYESMSEEQLDQEKKRLLKLLEEENNDTTKSSGKDKM